MAVSYKEQRVGVFIDIQNMYYSARNLYNARVNFDRILKTAIDNRTLIRAMAYVIEAKELTEQKNFFTALEKIGFELKTKQLQTFMNTPDNEMASLLYEMCVMFGLNQKGWMQIIWTLVFQ